MHRQFEIDAVNEGHVFRFLTKPCDATQIASVISAGLDQYRLVKAERDLLERTLAGSVKALVDALAMIHPAAFGKASRMRDWARNLSGPLKISRGWELEIAALLSPIGLVSIPPEVVAKLEDGSTLTVTEKEIAGRVPQAGYDVIANIPRLEGVAKVILYQNKQYDGGGFPSDDVVGSSIPLGARILKILADLSTLTSGPFPTASTFAKLFERRGRYDTELLATAQQVLERAANPGDRSTTADIAVKHLREGDTLQSDLQLENGQLVLVAGTQLSEVQVERVQTWARINTFKEPVQVMRRA